MQLLDKVEVFIHNETEETFKYLTPNYSNTTNNNSEKN